MDRIRQAIQQSADVKNRILADENFLNNIQKAADMMVESLRQGHRVLFCGNGGSAADAQHLSAELSGRFYYDRPPLNSEALHVNTSYLTAVANDYSYDLVYSRMVSASGSKGDVLVGISTSGNSRNILNAMDTAKEKGMLCIAMTGETGGKMKEKADILLNVPSTDTPRIQEAHIMTGHIICEIVESTLFPKEKK